MSESWRVVAFAASVLLWAAVGIAWAEEAGLIACLRRDWRVCPSLRRALAALVVAAAVACAGGKGGMGEGVSSKEEGVSAEFSSSVVVEGGTEKKEGIVYTYSLLPTPSSLNPAPSSLTDEDISRGYRLVAVATNEAHSYAMPADARLVGTWHLTDAYDAVARVFLEGVRSKEQGARGEGASSKEQGVSVDLPSSVVAGDGTEKDGNDHTYSLQLPPYSLSHSPFSFPLGGQVVTSLWAHVWGRARPQLWNASNDLVAVGAPMYARRGVSRLWTAATPSNTVLLTWQDFFFKGAGSKEQGAGGEEAGGKGVRSKEQVVSAESSSSVVAGDKTQEDVAHHTYSLLPTPCSFSPVSAQLELFRDGSFVARSNSVARVYRRVDPDDWDGDGIPNAEDDDPHVAADEPRFGPRQSLPPGAHTNNYCWVDLAVRDADALVSFAGDAPSDLPDPSFVAKAGETNRVTLLIGKRYTIRCLLPVEVVGKSSDAVEVRQEADGTLRLLWPVEIGVMEEDGDEEACAGGGDEGVSSKEQGVSADLSSSVVAADGTEKEKGNVHTYSLLLPPSSLTSSPSSFTMTLSPTWLVGSFAWTNACCRVAGDGLAFSFACGGACMCGGCAATGYFAYEGYRLPARGGACPCGGSGGAIVPGDGDDGEPDPLPGASARFIPSTVIFEDAYEPSEGVKEPRRSTRTTLVCSAFGGLNGGVSRFEAAGDDGVLHISGPTLPFERRLGPGESFKAEIVYEGQKGLAGGVRVTASFTDDSEDAQPTESVAHLNVAEIEIMPQVRPDANDSCYRHSFGVCEKVNCNFYPMNAGVRWVAFVGKMIESDGVYLCPTQTASNPLKAVCGGVEFTPSITVVEPEGIDARNPRCLSYGVKSGGRAGWVGLRQEFYVTPLGVSFSGISMEEVPSTAGVRTGYFARPGFAVIGCHSEAMGAGKWMPIGLGNRMGAYDTAGISFELLRVNADGELTDDPAFGWEDGLITWEIPFGWTTNEALRENATGATPLRVFDPNAEHRFEITPSGLVTVRKFGNSAQRAPDGRMYCNGIECQEEK